MNQIHPAALGLGVLLVTLAIAGCVATPGVAPGTELATEIRFENATAESGLDYVAEGRGANNGNAGVYVADVDRDGWQDVLAIGGERPVLFENREGTFERSDGLPDLDEPFKSALFVDRDGDGFEDLLLLRSYGSPVLLANRGDGTFERVESGIGELAFPVGAAPGDYDADGDIDLFVYQSGDWATGNPAGYMSLNPHVADDNGNPNVLYENVGGTFERVEDAGIRGDRWSLAASFVDLNDDGLPDVHVANDYNNDTVYLNRGDGTFAERLLPAPTARNGMSSEVGDFDGDGHPDVYTTNIELPVQQEMSPERYERLRHFLSYIVNSGRTRGNTLMLNDGRGNFTDAATEYDVRTGGWGWAAAHADLDSDGDADLLTTTQEIVQIDPDDPHYTYPMVWERTGTNFTSLDASDRGFDETDGRGMVTVDYDRDGDLDVILADNGGPVQMYENVGDGGNAVQLRVVDEEGGTVYGATVTVSAGGVERTVQQTARTDFLSQQSRVRHFGVGAAEEVTVRVEWPDGEERLFDEVEAGREVEVTREGVESVRDFGVR